MPRPRSTLGRRLLVLMARSTCSSGTVQPLARCRHTPVTQQQPAPIPLRLLPPGFQAEVHNAPPSVICDGSILSQTGGFRLPVICVLTCHLCRGRQCLLRVTSRANLCIWMGRGCLPSSFLWPIRQPMRTWFPKVCHLITHSTPSGWLPWTPAESQSGCR